MLAMAGFVFSLAVSPALLSVARAASLGQVIINEVNWGGSVDSSTDEWIELYNNSDQSVDLTNWHIDDDHGASDYVIVSGSVAAHGYFLIEDHEASVSNVTSDAIIDLSLANTGDSLQLYDPTGQLIDTVDGSGGAWYAGSSTAHTSMERIDSASAVDAGSNWADSTGSGALSSGGSAIVSTPKAVNSVALQGGGGGGSQQTTTVDFVANPVTLQSGGVLTLTANVNNVQDLFAYGFELHYDPAVLRYKSTAEKSFLNENGTFATALQANLLDSQEGSLIVADARTVQPKSGVTGSGQLFEVQFDVLQGTATNIQVASGSFLASTAGDIVAQFNPVSLDGQPGQVAAVTNLGAVSGPQRYSIALTWDAVAGAQNYRVFRKDSHGQMQQIADTSQVNFVDGDGVLHGGFVVPGVNYVYRVVAVQGALESQPSEVIGHDDRGLKGDSNRSDRVDGRDLESLAKHFAETDADSGFDPLVDTTYDGRVDGSDLIDLGAQFARTYQP